jgi:hypothetical protein
VTGFTATAKGFVPAGTVAVTQSAEAVPMHAATAMQIVSIPNVRLFGIICFSLPMFRLLLLNYDCPWPTAP